MSKHRDNTVPDSTWKKLQDADTARAVDRWGTRHEINRQQQAAQNRNAPRRS